VTTKGRRARDPYRLLGVSRGATQDELTLAYVRQTSLPDAEPEGPERKDLDTAYRLLWRPRTRERYDRLYRAAVRRMRLTLGLGSVSVLLLLVLGFGSGFWLANPGGQPVSVRAIIPFVRPVSPPATASRAAPAPPPSIPTPPNQTVRSSALNPASMTLTLRDLPSGYHLLSQGPASFSTSSAGGPPKAGVPPSWDVIFARDSGQPSSRRLVESLAVIYPQASTARQALTELEAAQAAQQATRQAPPAGLGQNADQWIERAPNGGSYTVVRLAWVTGLVVSQVSILDLPDPSTIEQAVALSLMQQRRLAG
jgi:hypothetical protein